MQTVGAVSGVSDRIVDSVEELAVVHLVIEPFPREEIVVSALLDDGAVVHDKYQVGIPDRREPVCDDETRAVLLELGDSLLDKDSVRVSTLDVASSSIRMEDPRGMPVLS